MSLDIPSLLRERRQTNPSSTVVVSPHGQKTSAKELEQRVIALSAGLRAAGLKRSDRIAVALPEGPAFATTILATTCTAICAPIDCEVPLPQLVRQLGHIRARAVILGPSQADPVKAAIGQTGPMVLVLEQEAGELRLVHAGRVVGGVGEPADCDPDAPALLLHTSGTTSQPKAVLLSHRNICLSAQSMARTLSLGESDRCLSLMPLFHVHGLVGTLLAPLVSGGASIQLGRFHAARFLDQLTETAPTWFSASPAILHQVSARASATSTTGAHKSLRFIRSASAPLSSALLDTLERQFGVPVIQAYGMTEASHQITTSRLSPQTRKPDSVGRPDIVELAILHPDGSRARAGEKGEIVIRGPTVITSYDGGRAANADAFHEGWLRTGDLGHVDEDGDLFIAGRLKEVINRGGEKISPVEVEEALIAHPALADAGVFPVPDERLGEEVAACVVTASGQEVSPREIQDFAAREIAGYKVPRLIFFAQALPKSSTGKLQRRLLGDLQAVRTGLAERRSGNDANAAAASGPLVSRLAGIWEEVLGVTAIGPHDDYFDLGGDSLQAVMILARVRTAFGVDLPVSALFDRPTVARLAREIEIAQAEANRQNMRPLQRHDFADDIRPLSFTQELILEVSANPLLADSSVFNRISAVRMQGPLDRDALDSAITGIVEAHEALRSNLAYRDRSSVVAVREPDRPTIEDLGECGGAEADSGAALRSLAIAFADRPYDLERDSLVRFGLVRLGEAAHLLLVGAHNFVFDGWSMDVFLRELAGRYAAAKENRAPALEPLDVRYGDYAQWQADLLASGALDAKLQYWKEQLSGGLPHVEFDRRSWTGPDNRFELQRRVLAIPEDVVRPLRKIAASNGATLNMVLLAALNILYGTLEGQREMIVLIQSAGRSERETERLIGNFVQTLPIRSRLEPGQSFQDHLVRVREQCLAAVANETVPFARLIRDMFGGRDLLLDPISPLLFVFKNFCVSSTDGTGVEFSLADLEYQNEVFGLVVKVHEGRGALDCNFLHNPVVVSPAEADVLARCYGAVLERIAANPEAKISALLPASVIVKTLGLRALAREALRKLSRRLRNAVS